MSNPPYYPLPLTRHCGIGLVGMMKATLFALFIALLMVGCGEQNQSVGSNGEVEDKPFLPSLSSFNPNESEFERIKRLAEGGDKDAQSNLGFMYYEGEGVPLDYKKAFKWASV